MDYFIKLKDILKNEEEVICTVFSVDTYEHQFEYVFQKLVDICEIPLEFTILKDEKKMIIYKVKDVLNKGYLYNSTTTEKINLFELSLLKINKVILSSFRSEHSKDIDDIVDAYTFDKVEQKFDIVEKKSTQKQFDDNSLFIVENVDKVFKFTNENPLKDNCFKFKFTEELKSKLNTPNLGLTKPIKNIYKFGKDCDYNFNNYKNSCNTINSKYKPEIDYFKSAEKRREKEMETGQIDIGFYNMTWD